MKMTQCFCNLIGQSVSVQIILALILTSARALRPLCVFQPRMAGILEEFDDATPLKGTFCSRLSLEEYEEEASSCTKRALEELMDHLDDNPDDLKAVLSKRWKDAEEEKGIWSFVKVLRYPSCVGPIYK